MGETLHAKSISKSSHKERAGRTYPRNPSSRVEGTHLAKRLKIIMRGRLTPIETTSRTNADGLSQRTNGREDTQNIWPTIFGLDWITPIIALKNSSSVGMPVPSPIAPTLTLGNRRSMSTLAPEGPA